MGNALALGEQGGRVGALRRAVPAVGEKTMNWNKTALMGTLAAGIILFSSGCTSKKDVAIAAKDDTIRRQEAATRSEQEARMAAENQARAQADQARLAQEQARQASELNRQLAQQNTDAQNQQAALLKVQAEASNAMALQISQQNAKLAALDESLKRMPAQNAIPGAEYHRGEGGSIHIRVAGSVLFDAGRAELRPGCNDMLMKAASTIRSQYPNNAIRIEGHTDSTPVVHSKDRYPDNMALSQARAAAVYEFMLKRGGISASRMYTAGYGDRQPLVNPEKTAADRAKNRRVEIVILPTNLNVQKDQLSHAGQSPKSFKASTTAPKGVSVSTSGAPKVVAASAPAPAK